MPNKKQSKNKPTQSRKGLTCKIWLIGEGLNHQLMWEFVQHVAYFDNTYNLIIIIIFF